jgi:glutaconyl-CoA decarboxylase
MGHPVTTNPIIIMVINMTIVFVVLISLSIVIRLIHVIDPTGKKKAAPAAAPKAAPKKAAAPAAAAAPKVDNNVNIAVIAAAVAAYGTGYKIVTVRPIEQTNWKVGGRAVALQNTVC